MIIRSRWRRAGGLGIHLGRVDSNEAVVIRADFGRGMPDNIAQAVALATAISRTNPRTVRDLIHIKISPAKQLTDEGLADVLALIEKEHVIPPQLPRLIVEHRKGDRPRHFHLVYPVVDPETGRAVRSHENFLHDEIASRLAEIRLGEPIVPGAHHRAVTAELDRRGLDAEVSLLQAHTHVMPGERLGQHTRQHAEALGHDADRIAADAYAMWRCAEGDYIVFDKACGSAGYTVARGERAVLLLHNASGASVPLARAVRQKAKAAGEPLDIRERDLRDAFKEAPALAEAREATLEVEEQKARIAVDRELKRLQQEAMLDGQRLLAERLRLIREHERNERKKRFKRALAARRAEIKADYARRDRVRRARVNRAFLSARIFDRPDLRKAVFAIAGGGIVLAGGGLGLALVAAGIAVATVPTRERARAIALESRIRREADRDETAFALKKAYGDIAAQQPAAKPRTLDFGAIPREHRALAGAFCRFVLDGAERPLRPDEVARSAAMKAVLGAQAGLLENAVRHGAGRGVLTILGWFDPSEPSHQRAVEIALKGDQPSDTGKRGPTNRRVSGRDGRGR